MTRRDWIGVAFVVAIVASVVVFRHVWIEPREWGAICAVVEPPVECLPRTATLWLQHWYAWGVAALVLGIWAFIGGPFAVTVAAVTLGAVATINYNATYGTIACCLGVWAWARRDFTSHARAGTAASHSASRAQTTA